MRSRLITTAALGALLLPAQAAAVAPAATYSVRYTAFRTPVARGAQAKVRVHTAPASRCTIRVVYQNGRVSLPALRARTTNGSGNTSWSWIVPASTAPGSWPVTVTCQSGGHTAKVSRRMTITG